MGERRTQFRVALEVTAPLTTAAALFLDGLGWLTGLPLSWIALGAFVVFIGTVYAHVFKLRRDIDELTDSDAASRRRDSVIQIIDTIHRDALELARRYDKKSDRIEWRDFVVLVGTVAVMPDLLSEDYPVAASRIDALSQAIDTAEKRNRLDLRVWIQDVIDTTNGVRSDLMAGVR